MFIAAYVGARPMGRPLPALAEAPHSDAAPLHLIYSFARDPAKDGRFEFYDPWQLDNAVAQQQPHQRGMLSLGGAGFTWGPRVPLEAWVAAAAESLQAMLQKYRLMGLDINYEEGLDEAGGFPEAMAGLIARLKAWRPDLLITVSPFDETWRHYRRLLQLTGDAIRFVNWQLYAELEEQAATAQQAVAAYERLAAELGGYGRLTLGVNTEPEEKRGPQLDVIIPAFRELKARGIGGAFVWALDNSCLCGYQAEKALLRVAEELPGTAAPGGLQQAPYQQQYQQPQGYQQPYYQPQPYQQQQQQWVPPGPYYQGPPQAAMPSQPGGPYQQAYPGYPTPYNDNGRQACCCIS